MCVWEADKISFLWVRPKKAEGGGGSQRGEGPNQHLPFMGLGKSDGFPYSMSVKIEKMATAIHFLL